MVECIFVPGGTLDVLPVFWQFAAEIRFVEISKDNENRVRVFSLCAGYLVSQVP